MNIIIYCALALIFGGLAGYFAKGIFEKNKISKVKDDAEKTLKQARDKSQEILRKADSKNI